MNILSKIFGWIFGWIGAPVARWILMDKGYRVLVLTRTDRIGHLMGEIDCVLREDRLRNASSSKVILLAPRGKVANAHVLKYWRRYLKVQESPWLFHPLKRAARHPSVGYREDMRPYCTAINETAKCFAILSDWGDRPPLLDLLPEDIERGEATLRQLGLPEQARYVSFHCRDGGYSPRDEHSHSFRNVSAESYLPAMAALRKRGIYGIRMGDPSMPPLPETDGVIDYVHSKYRSDWMDVFLCASCEFFLGSGSGLYCVAMAFGRPSGLANLSPLSTVYGGGPSEVGIPKLLWHEKEERLLGFREILSSPLGNARYMKDYLSADVRPLENDPDDVAALALEMIDRVRGEAQYDRTDKILQGKFRDLFRPGHYGYGSISRVGRDFLRRYTHLLD